MQNTGLAKRAEKAIRAQIYIIGFLDILKKHIQKKKGTRVKSRILVCKKNEEHIWVFTIHDKDNLMLIDKYNGTSSFYTQKPLDPENQMELECISIVEFLVFELINQRVKKEQLEKILFEIL